MHSENRLAYWRANLRLVAICLVIWFVCSYVFGVLLVEPSIYIFVLLIFFYAWRMNRIDKKFDVHED
jgi:uncharacterized membrane protein